jgi:methylated-DNA-[protein]-cysteine S-methyltransferase
MYDVVLEFPKMKVGVETRGNEVVGIRYLAPETNTVVPRNSLAEKAARQLERYRDDPDTIFDLPVRIEGSELQRAVWQAMRAIPRGRTRTYGDIAREIGTDARNVGQACGDNRLPIVIPCHRVVAADGIGGFSHTSEGFLIEVKRWLLLHEAEADAFQLTP